MGLFEIEGRLEKEVDTQRRVSIGDELKDACVFLADPARAGQLLSRSGGAQLIARWSDDTLAAGLVGLSDGRRLLLIERTYRDGIRVLFDPTETELAAAREKRLRDLWNSERSELIAGAI